MKKKIIQLLLKMGWTGLAYAISPSLTAYYQGKILLKRVIALPEDVVVIDGEGNVYINEELLEEPYVTSKELGDCDLEFPYTVPGTGYFVMGDQRANSVDSRNSVVGSVTREDIIGRVSLRVWPLSKIGFVY